MFKTVGKDKIVIFNQDQTVSIHGIEAISTEAVLTQQGTYPIQDCDKYIDTVNGSLVYTVNASIPAKVEAENIRNLRKSTVLKTIFEFERSGKFDYMKLIPWVIIALLILKMN